MTNGKHIIAMGGGGFSMEPENPLLDDYILSTARSPKPKVCFVPTAGGDSDNYCMRFYESFSQRNCAATHLALIRRKITDLRTFVLGQDVIYVGGGNTANMLAIWRVHGLDAILREAYAQGVVLCGLSAGSLCWFEAGVTDSFGPPLAALNDGLGLITGSNCPHYDGEAERRPTYHRLIANGLRAGHAADDGCALHFISGQLHRAVTSRKNAKGYYVELRDGSVEEKPLDVNYLG